MADHPNVQILQRGMEAFGRGDMETVAALFSDDVVVHYPGHHQLAGDHKGRDAVVAMLNKIGELTGGTANPAPHTILADDEHVVSLETFTATREDKTLKANDATIAHVKDGKVTEMWFLTADPDAHDEFWGR